jgi:transcriptional regulator
MYLPPYNRVDDEAQIRAMVSGVGSAQFVTVDDDGFPSATLLPVLWEQDTVIAHMARANPQWRTITPGSPVLLIVSGPEAYISPSWYAAKYEHGRVVPTWNYSAVHLSGVVTVHQDADWLRTAVERLTVAHEQGRSEPWQVTDAPAPFIQGQLAGIVGLQVSLQRVQAKAKLSQNRSAADRRGVVEGLRNEPAIGAAPIADAMATELTD